MLLVVSSNLRTICRLLIYSIPYARETFNFLDGLFVKVCNLCDAEQRKSVYYVYLLRKVGSSLMIKAVPVVALLFFLTDKKSLSEKHNADGI